MVDGFDWQAAPQTLVFPYRPKWYAMALAVVFFGACAPLIAMQAMENDRGLIINHIIEMGPQGATAFYWALVLAAVGFVVLGIAGLHTALTSRHVIRVDADAVTAPRNAYTREPERVAFSDVAFVRLMKVSGQEMLQLTLYSGRKFVIVRSWLPNKAAFDEVLLAVDAAMKRQLL